MYIRIRYGYFHWMKTIIRGMELELITALQPRQLRGSKEYMQSWNDNVLRNFSVYKSSLYIDKPGRHTLQSCCTDPGMVMQKIVIDLGGMKQSFLGPMPEKIK